MNIFLLNTEKSIYSYHYIPDSWGVSLGITTNKHFLSNIPFHVLLRIRSVLLLLMFLNTCEVLHFCFYVLFGGDKTSWHLISLLGGNIVGCCATVNFKKEFKKKMSCAYPVYQGPRGPYRNRLAHFHFFLMWLHLRLCCNAAAFRRVVSSTWRTFHGMTIFFYGFTQNKKTRRWKVFC